MDYLLLVKLDASRRFREYLSVGDRCFLTNLLPPSPTKGASAPSKKVAEPTPRAEKRGPRVD